MPRPPLAAAIAVAVLGAAAAPAAADDPVPSTRLSAVVGIRNGTQSLDDQFGFGVLYGIEASWSPMPEGRRIGFGIHWNALFGDFGEDNAAITGELDILEMAFGVRLRLAPESPDRSLFLGGGIATLRASTPLPPDDERVYVGGFAGIGVEQLAWKRSMITLEVRYGLIYSGPGSISVLLGVGFGK